MDERIVEAILAADQEFAKYVTDHPELSLDEIGKAKLVILGEIK
jgi:hypothetical protein